MNNTALTVADLMGMATLTAPKARGQDCISYITVSGKDLELLAEEMIAYSEKDGKKFFARDAENIRNSEALLLVTINSNKKAGLNCGACGTDSCDSLSQRDGSEYPGPFCAWRMVDIGIAIGSAVKTAGILNADNRVMYSVGVIARKIGITDHPFAVGIPISFTSKNIYFDR